MGEARGPVDAIDRSLAPAMKSQDDWIAHHDHLIKLGDLSPGLFHNSERK
jgi:hypothetical protein